MTVADVLAYWPQLVTGLGGLGGGGLISGYLTHKRATRRQTDEVALDLVKQLQERVTEVEQRANDRIAAVETAAAQERLICDAKLEAADHKLSVVRHELGNVESVFDGLLLAIRFAPPDKVPEIVELAQKQRAERAQRKGEARQLAQIEVSAHRVIPDIDG